LPTAVALEQMKGTEKMGDYKPSTLIDHLAGRPLEIEAIWGESLRAARDENVDAPQLEKIYRELVALDRASRK
jgi:2-dehydropantoate 2-reductase